MHSAARLRAVRSGTPRMPARMISISESESQESPTATTWMPGITCSICRATVVAWRESTALINTSCGACDRSMRLSSTASGYLSITRMTDNSSCCANTRCR
jgi:hypothetical protein